MRNHSSAALTSDTYTSVLPEVAHEAAEAVARLALRQKRSQAHTSPGIRPTLMNKHPEAGGYHHPLMHSRAHLGLTPAHRSTPTEEEDRRKPQNPSSRGLSWWWAAGGSNPEPTD